MSDALVDLGIQDALRYVHVNILPSVVLVCRDVAHIAVISVSCVFFAWSLARASSLFGALAALLRCFEERLRGDALCNFGGTLPLGLFEGGREAHHLGHAAGDGRGVDVAPGELR